MTSALRHLTIDCADAWALGEFWRQVTGYTGDPANPNEPGDDEYLIVPPAGGLGLLFIPVPEGKSGKNRLHLDIAPDDRTRDEEVERLLTLGASVFEDHRRPDGTGWVTMRDPEGNEFCVERSAAERA
ncbi:VOC family protein [Kineosporia succinea]|uniref:Catechol 2,3-dioxygenase-like lactoylglutathione lyase family enzyme n=1 Tax=Kineosporia succinea TaxID=84632 RepID=A0ABT9P997_9ACTN|nr:VOC family protein [Kineosporia succinea]MDP9829269.1 catechol 2,3-dioxygenase-like lactoylglutathione lyase family enzyme [Kineosporia succinea]